MKHAIDVKIGRRLREARTYAGMPQSELAGLIGISYQQVQKYEKGENRISASKLWEISNALGISVDKLYPDLTDREATRDGPGGRTKEISAIRNFLKLGEHEKRAVAALISSLAESGYAEEPKDEEAA